MGAPPRIVYRHALRDSRRWDAVALRPTDIVISTPTKSGTTWMQRICALLILQSPELDQPLDRLSPWVDFRIRPIDEVARELAEQSHRRFIKTHTPLDGLAFEDDVTYICVGRDPRDVALSWFNHQSNQNRDLMLALRDSLPEHSGEPTQSHSPERTDDSPPLSARFRAWVDDPTPPNESACTLRLTLHHLATFWAVRHRPNVILVHYADLLEDLDRQMRLLSHRLAIPIDADRWTSLVRAAGLQEMRAAAGLLAPDASLGAWRDNEQFFRQGGQREWRDRLNDTELAHYWGRVNELAPPEMARWLHREPASAGR